MSEIGIKPLNDNLLVEDAHDTEDQLVDGIYIPDTAAASERPQEVRVVAMGPGKRDGKGGRLPFEVKVGDLLLIGKEVGMDIVSNKEYRIISASDILAVI